jgi:hypothetical protein
MDDLSVIGHLLETFNPLHRFQGSGFCPGRRDLTTFLIAIDITLADSVGHERQRPMSSPSFSKRCS